MTKICQNCKTENPDSADFCQSCGEDLKSRVTKSTTKPQGEAGGWWSKQSTGAKAAIGLVGVCCIGLIIFIAFAGMFFSDQTTSNTTSTANNMSLDKLKVNATNVTVEELYSGSVPPGTPVRIYARALDNSGTEIRVSSIDDMSKDVMVNLQSEVSGIYEDDYVYVYGIFNGDEEYTTVLFSQRKIPSIINAFVVKQQ